MALAIQNQGGIIIALSAAGRRENWLASREQEKGTERYFGHFLCFDRWGPVTADESARGLSYHGEAGAVTWKWGKVTDTIVELSTTLPVARLRARRAIRMIDSAGIASITNVFQNPTDAVRDYNVVEHVLLSPHWLSDDVRLTSNVVRGFVQINGEEVADSEFEWPKAHVKGRARDLTQSTMADGIVVASLVFAKGTEWGWVCLQNSRTSELLGYVWRVADYPWLNLYWAVDQGRVLDRGIEPGSTGMSQPMAVLQETRTKLGEAILRSLPPRATRLYRMWCIALRTPRDSGSVKTLIVKDEEVCIDFKRADHTIALPMN